MEAAQPAPAPCGCGMWQHTRGGPPERLWPRFPSAQGVEGEAAGSQVHLTAHQPMGPERSPSERGPPQLHRTICGRAPPIDPGPPQWPLQALPPPGGKRPPGWGSFAAGPGALVVGGEIAGRPGLEGGAGGVMQPLPDLRLPLGLAAFHGGLKARLPRGGEPRHDREGQTQAAHTAHRIGRLMGALHPGLVIALGTPWQAPGTPMLAQRVEGRLGGDSSHGPGRHQPAMPRDPGEDLHLGPSGNDQACDPSQASARRVSGGTPGHIPAPWRAKRRPMVRTEGGDEQRRAVNSRWIATAPHSPRSLRSCTS
jgi:hypothetical protein